MVDVVKRSSDPRLNALLSEKMTTDEQRLFADSFKMYLDYGRDDTAFVVDFDDVWKWVGFSNFANAKRVLVKKFVDGIDYVMEKALIPPDERFFQIENERAPKQNGGQNKINIKLTVNTFKKFCILADTPVAKKIQDYYLKMESILQDYIEICMNELHNNNKMLKDNCEWKHHEGLLAGYNNRKLVYVLHLLDFDDGMKLIKIGSTTDIRGRIQSIGSKYKLRPKVLAVFSCERHVDFEKSVQQSSLLIKYRYNDAINDTVTSIETFKVHEQV